MPGRFARRVVIVTGGAAGIGLATAKAYVAEGADVAIVDINAGAVREAARAFDVFGVVADLTDEAAVADMVDQVVARFGAVDVLVNLAGVYGQRPLLEEQTLAGLRHALATNLESAFLCCQKVAPHMRARGYGRIVTTASGTFHNPQPGLSAYVAAKGGTIGMTRVLAKELGPHGITINIIMPGLIATEHVLTMVGETVEARATVDGFFARTLEHQSIKRRGLPEDLAHGILFLTEEASGFITGQTLQFDGGSTFT
jgi:NAD(P)-dependent dehydrogenase (short-subunit alcohol dehydrogenase family)